MPDVDALSLPFDEAVAFFREKARLPTARWTDIWQAQHGRAFVVAGAMRDDALSDLQTAIQKALEDGESLGDFLKRFREIVDRTGWRPRGILSWRARLVYRTNLSTAYAVGRYRQMREPDMLAVRPYWRYRHGGSADPRPEHLEWDGLILPADDPFWETHTPPNGWGCSCYVEPLTQRQVDEAGGVSERPQTPTRTWRSRDGTRTEEVPEGIDPGWAYNVGRAGDGRHAELLDGDAAWTELPAPDPGPLPLLPVDAPEAELGRRAHGEADLRAALRQAIGGDDATFSDPTGAPVRVTQAVVDHMLGAEARQDGREQYFPLIRGTVERPAEIWVSFARREDGKIGVRRRYVRLFQLGGGRTLGIIAESIKGYWVAATTYRGQGARAAKGLRRGHLVYRRPGIGDAGGDDAG